MFYDNLKAECERQGLKITPLTIECGGATGSIARWKYGAAPTSDIVVRFAERLGVTTDYLLTGEEKEQPKPTPTENIKFALFNGTDGITDEMYEEVKQFAEMVKMREESKRK